MTTSYPSNLDALSNPVSGDLQSSVTVPHSTQHANVNDAIEAIEAALGILPQAGYATVRARLEALEAAVAALGSGVVAAVTDNSITGAKLVDASITTAKLASNAVSNTKIQSGAISTGNLADLSVTGLKIAAGAISYDKRAASSKGNWKRVANQAIAGTTSAYISWDTELTDTDGFVAAVPTTTITIPSGKAGLYLIGTTLNGFLTTVGSYLQIEISTGALIWRSGVPGTIQTLFALADIAVNGTIKVLANNGNAGSMNATGQIFMVKLFDA